MAINLDIETSAPLSVKDLGGFAYAEQPELVIVCVAWRSEAGQINLWDTLNGEPIPDELESHARAGGLLKAYNAGFEMAVLSGRAGQKIGFPKTKIGQWRDTAAKVAAHGLPRSLGLAAKALPGVPHKDETGKLVMMRLSRPTGLAKATPEQMAMLYDYCKNDVAVEAAIDALLPDLPAGEQRLWEIDYQINKRGFLVDRPLIGKIRALIEQYTTEKTDRCKELTGANPTQRQVIMDWCAAQGYPLRGYTAEDINWHLKDRACTGPVREVLEIRKATAFAAVKKYKAIETSVCADGRLRGMFLFHGAATGRWTGRGAQLHNLSRPVLLKKPQQVEDAINRINQGLYPVEDDALVLSAFKDLVRSCLVAPEDHVLEVCDFSSIEARVIGWMANDPLYQDAFQKGLDLYKVTAGFIFGVSYDEVNDDQRFLGKQAVLGLSYQMGVKKFIDTVKRFKDVPDELIQKAHATYRERYAPIVQLWTDFGRAAIKAVQSKRVQTAGRCQLGMVTKGPVTFLYTQLPSGRRIAYYQPMVEEVDTPWGAKTTAFTASFLNETTKQLERVAIHGGLLAQHATQGIARDLLAAYLLSSGGKQVVGHVHDEVIKERHSRQKPSLAKEMSICPAWGEGIHMHSEAFETQRYRK